MLHNSSKKWRRKSKLPRSGFVHLDKGSVYRRVKKSVIYSNRGNWINLRYWFGIWSGIGWDILRIVHRTGFCQNLWNIKFSKAFGSENFWYINLILLVILASENLWEIAVITLCSRGKEGRSKLFGIDNWHSLLIVVTVSYKTKQSQTRHYYTRRNKF